MEALVARRATLMAKKADLEKKIREVGTLPADAYERFRSLPLKELHKLLAKAISQLKKYGHVNKKALDQYNNFTEEVILSTCTPPPLVPLVPPLRGSHFCSVQAGMLALLFNPGVSKWKSVGLLLFMLREDFYGHAMPI